MPRSIPHRTVAKSAAGRARAVLLVVSFGALLLLALGLWRFSSTGPAVAVHVESAGPDVTQRDAVELDERAEIERGRAAVEQAPAPLLDASAPMLELVVSWPDGEPVADARIAITLEPLVLAHGTTDAHGIWVTEPVSEPGARVHVVVDDVQVLAERLPSGAGTVRLAVPSSSLVAGRVRVDGASPDEAIELSLRTAAAGPLPASPPLFLVDALRWSAMGTHSVTADTDAEGRFRFGGLAATWHGRLGIPRDYRFAVAGAGSIEHPAIGLAVDLVRAPAIVGRVLAPDGEPLAGAVIRCTMTGPSSINSSEVRSGSDGRFRAPLPVDRVERASLDVLASGAGAASLAIDVDPERGADVGDVRLAYGRDVRLLVTDREGTPLVRAIAASDTERSAPSAANGICVMKGLPAERARVRVDALRYRTRELWIEPDAEQPVPVVLERMTSLEVAFRDVRDVPAPGLRLIVRSPAALESPSGVVDDVQRELGASSMPHSEIQHVGGAVSSVTLTLEGDRDGRVLVTGLPPGVRIELEATDASGAALGWSDAVALAEGEQRQIEVALETEVGFLRGRVVDTAGQPVRGTSLRFLGGTRESLRVDDTGAFEAGPLHAASVDFAVEAPEHASRVIRGHPLSTPAEIVLDAGRTVIVGVVDADGHPHPADGAAALVHGVTAARGTPLGDGRFTIEHVPLECSELRVTVAGCKRLVALGRSDTAVLRIATPGSLAVRWQRPLPDGAAAALRLETPGEEPCLVWRELDAETIAAGVALVPLVLPGRYVVELMVDEDRDGRKEPRERSEVDLRAGERGELVLPP